MGVNVENMRVWVARLRDPDAKKAKGQLREGDGFCCLGHACDVSGLGTWNDAEQYVIEGDTTGPHGYLLPPGVLEWLGLTTGNGNSNPTLVSRIGGPNGHSFAATLNDKSGWSLRMIADAVEATWPEVKVTA